MDGLLINSEPWWQQAEIEIFRKVDICLTREMCMETMGLRIDEVITHWHTRYPWTGTTKAALEDEIIDTVIKYIHLEAGPMEGVYEILDLLRGRSMQLALASSSPFRIIRAVVAKLGIGSYFQVLHSAEAEKYGKPHPDIYIHTAAQLGVTPMECVAFEDSFNGLVAARAARMKTVAVPDPVHSNHPRFGIAHIRLSSLKEFTPEHLYYLDKEIT